MRFFVAAMVLMFGVGMAVWLVLYRNYTRILWDVRNSEYKTELVKRIVRRYIDCRKLNIEVRNVEVFVEKSVIEHEICGLSQGIVSKVGKSMEYLIVIVTALAVVFYRNSMDETYMCIVLGVLSAVALHLCRRLADIDGVQWSIVVELTDYLENSGELPYVTHKHSASGKLSTRAYMDFVKLNRCFNRIYSTRQSGGRG